MGSRDTASHDRILHVLDRDWRINETRNTSTFARRRADATRKLREIIGLVQPIERVAPLVLVDQSVEFGNEVVDGTPSMRVWQNGVPQSMHRAACTMRSTGSWPSELISSQSVTRSMGARYGSGLPLVVDEASDITNDLDGAVSPFDLGQGVVVVVSAPSLVVLRGLGAEKERAAAAAGAAAPAACAARHALAGAAQHRSSFWRSKAHKCACDAASCDRRCGAGVFSH